MPFRERVRERESDNFENANKRKIIQTNRIFNIAESISCVATFEWLM